MNLFAELKRRGVVQVGAAYIVTAWLLIQVADVLFPVFDVPDWIMRAMVLLLAIGFPISILISWFFDLTSQGFIRTADLPEDGSVARVGSGRLNAIIIGVLAAAVVLFALDKFVWQSELEPAGSAAHSIAVLPFDNMSQDPQNDAFAAGIHDDLLTQLSKINAFQTLSRTSMLRFSGTQLPIPEIAREVGAEVVLEGGVQRSADRVRINAQLIDGKKDVHLWAETFDRQLSAQNIFAIQSDIARAIAVALRATLNADEQQRLDFVPTKSLDAYDAYASGLASLNEFSVEEYDRAVAQFQLATELDPEFASAWAGLCRAELSRYTKTNDPDFFHSAESACQTALELDNSRVEVHIALGALYRHFGQYARAEVALERANYAKAEQQLEKALSLNAMTIEAKVELARVLMRQDRLEEAESHLREAEQMAPINYEVQTGFFSLYYVYGTQVDRFEKAASHAAKLTSTRPDLAASWNNLGSAQYMLNHYDDAAAAWEESLRIEPTRTGYTNTGLAYFYAGRYTESADMQRKAIGLAPNDHRAWGRLGDALKQIKGEQQNSLEAFTKAAHLASENLAVNDRDWRTRGMMATYLAQIGKSLEAEQAISESIQDSDRRASTLYYAAMIEMLQGSEEAALGLLEEAAQRDPGFKHLIAAEPEFWPLAESPRFKALISNNPAEGDPSA